MKPRPQLARTVRRAGVAACSVLAAAVVSAGGCCDSSPCNFEEHIRDLAGPDALDCGSALLEEEFEPAAACVHDALEMEKAFIVRFVHAPEDQLVFVMTVDARGYHLAYDGSVRRADCAEVVIQGNGLPDCRNRSRPIGICSDQNCGIPLG